MIETYSDIFFHCVVLREIWEKYCSRCGINTVTMDTTEATAVQLKPKASETKCHRRDPRYVIVAEGDGSISVFVSAQHLSPLATRKNISISNYEILKIYLIYTAGFLLEKHCILSTWRQILTRYLECLFSLVLGTYFVQQGELSVNNSAFFFFF